MQEGIFLASDFSSTFLNTWTTDQTFQQSGKQDLFTHILKRYPTMYNSSGILSGLDASKKLTSESNLLTT